MVRDGVLAAKQRVMLRAVAELEVLTRRRIGELLPAKGKGGRGKTVTSGDGLERQRQAEARKLAEVPQADLDAYPGRGLSAKHSSSPRPDSRVARPEGSARRTS